jgi:hypothetical protein
VRPTTRLAPATTRQPVVTEEMQGRAVYLRNATSHQPTALALRSARCCRIWIGAGFATTVRRRSKQPRSRARNDIAPQARSPASYSARDQPRRRHPDPILFRCRDQAALQTRRRVPNMSRTQHFSGQPGPLSRSQSPVDTVKVLEMAHYGTEGQRFESSRAHHRITAPLGPDQSVSKLGIPSKP